MVEENVSATNCLTDVSEEDLTSQDFINLNEDVAVCGGLTDAEILAELRKEMEFSSSDEGEE